MGGYWTFAHSGSFIVIQCRYDLRRHSSSQAGSSFLVEMRRITSSLRPGATVSDSISVTKPYLYCWLASCSIFWVEVVMFLTTPEARHSTPPLRLVVGRRYSTTASTRSGL